MTGAARGVSRARLVVGLWAGRRCHQTHLERRRWQSTEGVSRGGWVGCRHTVLFGARARRRSIAGVGGFSSVGGMHESYSSCSLTPINRFLDLVVVLAGVKLFLLATFEFLESSPGRVVRHFTGMCVGDFSTPFRVYAKQLICTSLVLTPYFRRQT